MISAREIEARTNVVGSSADELNSVVNEYIDPSLVSFHVALSEAFGKNDIYQLYHWLHQETQSYLNNAANAAMNIADHIKNYSEAVQDKLIIELDKEPYKFASVRKKELLLQLVKFYKTIMVFKADIGKRILAVSEDKVTHEYIKELNKTFELTKGKILEGQQRALVVQNELEQDLHQLTSEKIVEFHARKFQWHLQNKVAESTSSYEKMFDEIKDFKGDTSAKLALTEKAIMQVKAQSSIQEKKYFSENLVNDAGISRGVSQLFTTLANEEAELNSLWEEKANNQNLNLHAVLNCVMNARAELLRQKTFLDVVLIDEHVKYIDINPCVDTLSSSLMNQATLSFNSKWCSKKPGSVLSSLEEVKRAANFTYALSPVCNEIALQASRNKIDVKLYTLDQKLIQIKDMEESIANTLNKTKKLHEEFIDKKQKLQESVKQKFLVMQRQKINETQEQINKMKDHYLSKLNIIADQCRQDLKYKNQVESLIENPNKEQMQTTFDLPKSRKYLLPGVAGEFFGIGIASLAAVVFMSTLPIGLGIAAGVTAGAIMLAGGVCLVKGYNRYKKNKILKKYDEPVQKELFETNEGLKKLKMSSTTRHLIMKYKITLDKETISQNTQQVVFKMNGLPKAQLVCDLHSKKLLIGPDKIPVDPKNFQEQVHRLSAC